MKAKQITLLHGDVLTRLESLPSDSVQCCVTSPPYWGLRDYGTGLWKGGDPTCDHSRKCSSVPHGSTLASAPSNSNHEKEGWLGGVCGKCGSSKIDQQLGLEKTPEEYVNKMVTVFAEVRRVLRPDGTLWLVIGDSYNAAGRRGHGTRQGYKQGTNRASAANADHCRPSAKALKQKDLVGIPWMTAFALRASGWYLRQEIIWAKPNPMPESVTDRCTRSHESVFLFTKSPKYYFDHEALKEIAVSKKGFGVTGRGNQGSAIAVAAGGRNGAPQQDHSGWMGGDGVTRSRRDVWTITAQPYKGAHFAVFPEALVEPCILASISQFHCATCGMAWRRVTRRTPMKIRRSVRIHEKGHTRSSGTQESPSVVETLGWHPSCVCKAEKSAGTVLDPFMGSGTVGVVCKRFGLRFTGIDLNKRYLAMARQRINAARRMDS